MGESVQVVEVKGQPIVKRLFYFAFIFIGVGIVIWAIYTLINGFNTKMEFVKDTTRELCGYETCIIADAVYKDGWVAWEVAEGWPLNFALTASGYDEDEEVEVVCPAGDVAGILNHLPSKIAFLFDKEKLEECYVRDKS